MADTLPQAPDTPAVVRARALLAAGVSVEETAELTGVHVDTVRALPVASGVQDAASGAAGVVSLVVSSLSQVSGIQSVIVAEWARRLVSLQVERDRWPAGDRARPDLEARIDAVAKLLLDVHSTYLRAAGPVVAAAVKRIEQAGARTGMGHPPTTDRQKGRGHPPLSTYYENVELDEGLLKDAITMQRKHLKELERLQKEVKREVVGDGGGGAEGGPVG